MPNHPKLDCRHYIGDRPCRFGGPCDGCEDYAPVGAKVLVVKLAAAGDVLRSTAVLPGIRETTERCHVTWVTEGPSVPLLEGHPLIDRLLVFGFDAWLELSRTTFDLVLCLDKDPRAAAFADSMQADARRGFGLSEWGTVRALNDGAEYDLALGLSNEMKFHENTLTYPEIVCRVAGVPYARQPYVMALGGESIVRADAFLETLTLKDPVIGLNVGAGPVFAKKAWTPAGYADLARRITAELEGSALVLGGPDDRPRMERVLELSGGAAVDGGLHPLAEFSALVGRLDALVTGDTMALHIAVALGVPVVAIFGPTVPQEIDLFDRGTKVVTSATCAPCYRRACDETPDCMDDVSVDEVFGTLRQVIGEDA
ncbi:MAG: glycosyltransferase family 9 protein [Candidatus Eisenbacteria bacterium]|nr:glycosyltransferase family 9 protein [Candidatus Eisenbacteria bacterium]